MSDQTKRKWMPSWSSRKAAVAVMCPRCGTEPGNPCCGTRGIRRALHVERYGAAKLRAESARNQ